MKRKHLTLLSSLPKHYRVFALLVLAGTVTAYVLFAYAAYHNHHSTTQKSLASERTVIANSTEVFMDSVFRQAEFFAHKIAENGGNDLSYIHSLLKRKFSLDVSLDTSLLSKWAMFNWVDPHHTMLVSSTYGVQNSGKIESGRYQLYSAKTTPWQTHFSHPYTLGPQLKDRYLPVSFGVTDRNDALMGYLVTDINLSHLIGFIQHHMLDKQLHVIVLDDAKRIVAQSSGHAELPITFFKDTLAKPIPNNNIHHLDMVYTLPHRVHQYPFNIVIGKSETLLNKPLYDTLLTYLAFFLILFGIYASLLYLFYRKMASPVTAMAELAHNILDSKGDITPPRYTPSEEFTNLTHVLMRIYDDKKDMESANQSLHSRNKELEDCVAQLSQSYSLYDKLLKTNTKRLSMIDATQLLSHCTTIAYPQLLKYQASITQDIQDNLPALHINQAHVIQLIVGLIFRCLVFSSKKHNHITLSASMDESENQSPLLQLTICDTCIGDEDWRSKHLGECGADTPYLQYMGITYSRPFLECLAANMNIKFSYQNNNHHGVHYILQVPCQAIQDETESQAGNVIAFPERER